MKIHYPIMSGLVESLHHIFNDKYYADKVLERIFKKNRRWGARDRRFVAEGVYDIVRWWRKLLYINSFNITGEYSQEQLWQVALSWLVMKGYPVPQYKDMPVFNENKIRKHLEHLSPESIINYSIPDWTYNYGSEQLGESWPSILGALNQQASIYLRTNKLKINRQDLIQLLRQEGIEAVKVPQVESALVLKERANVFATQCFKKGFFEVQDAGSQMIAPFLQVEPGMRVIDACAGAGGKSLHLAMIMENKGKILALDIHEWKLNNLKQRAARGGVDIIERKTITNTKFIKRNKENCDRLLLDVPCSGFGVLKRNPDTKWKFSKESLVEVLKTQKEILQNYSSMLKVGGKLVYATCSIFPEENNQQVQAFLSSNSNWQLEEEVHVLPDQLPFDGFYFARLKRNG